jgi:hypothetical protein
MVLTNFQLEEMAEERGLNLIGIFSKNQLPSERVVGSYIVNMQDYDQGDGSHWVAFILFSNGKACYFDSFGFPMPREINSFLIPFKPVATNNRTIQCIKSTMCGYFCLAFIEYFNDVDPQIENVFELFDDFLNCFSHDAKKNDVIVKELLKKFK